MDVPATVEMRTDGREPLGQLVAIDKRLAGMLALETGRDGDGVMAGDR